MALIARPNATAFTLFYSILLTAFHPYISTPQICRICQKYYYLSLK